MDYIIKTVTHYKPATPVHALLFVLVWQFTGTTAHIIKCLYKTIALQRCRLKILPKKGL